MLTDVSQQLSEMGADPELVKSYLALLVLLKDQNPEQLRSFVKSVSAQAEIRKAISGGGQQTPAAPVLPQRASGATQGQAAQGVQAFSVEMEVEVTHFLARLAVADQPGSQTQPQAPTQSQGQARGQGQQSVTVSESQTTMRVRISFESGRLVAKRVPEDPLTLDLNGNGAFDVKARARFDLDVDGRTDDIAFVSDGDAFLALDRNGNGKIDDGSELFGDQNGSANGYEELAKYDDNRDGVIDRSDSVFERLSVLGDFDGDGDPGELLSAAASGVESVSLRYEQTRERIASDVTLAQKGGFIRNGREGLAGVLLLKYA